MEQADRKKERCGVCSTSGLLQCQQREITQSITLLLAGGQGAADTLPSGARPPALCSVMVGPALHSAPVSQVSTQHVCMYTTVCVDCFSELTGNKDFFCCCSRALV